MNRKRKLLIALANSFSAGLFFAVALFHILPEAEMDFSQGMKWKSLNEKFPLPFLIVIVVYGMILYLEKIHFSHDVMMDGQSMAAPESARHLEGIRNEKFNLSESNFNEKVAE
jgi:hypothetical protein